MPTVVNAENYKDKRQNIITNYFDTNKKKNNFGFIPRNKNNQWSDCKMDWSYT